jgi:hypothetical protein
VGKASENQILKIKKIGIVKCDIIYKLLLKQCVVNITKINMIFEYTSHRRG